MTKVRSHWFYHKTALHQVRLHLIFVVIQKNWLRAFRSCTRPPKVTTKDIEERNAGHLAVPSFALPVPLHVDGFQDKQTHSRWCISTGLRKNKRHPTIRSSVIPYTDWHKKKHNPKFGQPSNKCYAFLGQQRPTNGVVSHTSTSFTPKQSTNINYHIPSAVAGSSTATHWGFPATSVTDFSAMSAQRKVRPSRSDLETFDFTCLTDPEVCLDPVIRTFKRSLCRFNLFQNLAKFAQE